MKFTITQDFIVLQKICVPFPCGPDIETLSCWILICVCVGGGGGGGGYFYVVIFL